jgi:hypothetical protein
MARDVIGIVNEHVAISWILEIEAIGITCYLV